MAWFLVWPVAHAFILIQFGTGLRMAWHDSLLSNLLLGFACFDITFILRYYHSKKKGWYMLLVWSAGLAVVSLAVTNIIIAYFYSGEEGYAAFFQKTLPIRVMISFLIISSFMLLDRLMYYASHHREENERKMNIEKLSKDAELAMLRQQLQPHFLFNTLNSVSALVNTNQEEARRMIQYLSDFLRGTVKKDDQQFVDLASELKQVQLYLEIEKVRFGHRLQTIVEHDEVCLQYTLPPLLLQPLVENAIKFALFDTIGAVTISIGAKAENNHLIIKIENPFDGGASRPRQGTGFGLSSVGRRLFLLFSRSDLLQTQVIENTFIVDIKIPQKHD